MTEIVANDREIDARLKQGNSAAVEDFRTVPQSQCPLNPGSVALFADYHPKTKIIRVWMRTAVRKQVTSFGTFLSTLCHEFCHHLDYSKFKYGDSWHTRGFYERSAAIYHQARGTPPKRLFWVRVSGDRWRIDWPRTNRGF